MMDRSDSRSMGDLLVCFLGPTVWAAHFFLMYGAETLVCSRTVTAAHNFDFSMVAIFATAIAVASLTGLIVRQTVRRAANRQPNVAFDPASSFLRETSIMLAVLAMLGVLWVALPAILVPGCALPGG
jgi:hypothetical protein